MNKKLINILFCVFLCLFFIFVMYRVYLVNQLNYRIKNFTMDFMDNISSNDYDKIKLFVKKKDGSDLSELEMFNFLVNTGLYRAIYITDKNSNFTYSVDTDFFNLNKANILFEFVALNGDAISNDIEFVYTDDNEYFITDNILDLNKEKTRYPISNDLANGKIIEHNDENSSNIINMYSFVKDENNNVFIEVINETYDDVKMLMLNMIKEEQNNLKNTNVGYNIKWDDEYRTFSL